MLLGNHGTPFENCIEEPELRPHGADARCTTARPPDCLAGLGCAGSGHGLARMGCGVHIPRGATGRLCEHRVRHLQLHHGHTGRCRHGQRGGLGRCARDRQPGHQGVAGQRIRRRRQHEGDRLRHHVRQHGRHLQRQHHGRQCRQLRCGELRRLPQHHHGLPQHRPGQPGHGQRQHHLGHHHAVQWDIVELHHGGQRQQRQWRPAAQLLQPRAGREPGRPCVGRGLQRPGRARDGAQHLRQLQRPRHHQRQRERAVLRLHRPLRQHHGQHHLDPVAG